MEPEPWVSLTPLSLFIIIFIIGSRCPKEADSSYGEGAKIPNTGSKKDDKKIEVILKLFLYRTICRLGKYT